MNVLRQLHADLIGKDSYRGVTLTYVWMANQFGHFSLGFIPTVVFHRFCAKGAGAADALRFALYVWVFWILFEAYNFLGPLWHKRRSKSKVIYVPGRRYVFEPAWRNIAFDTATDLLFFGLGAVTASLVCKASVGGWLLLAALMVCVVYPTRYWFLTKLYLQAAQYPLQFRLSQWENAIDEAEIQTVNDFLADSGKGSHLLIFGSKGSGKTSLSIAIATELSIRHRACVYSTGIKLCSMFFEPAVPPQSLWDWRCADVLVIDDINPGEPIHEDLITPAAFLQYIDTLSENEANRQVLKETTVIWVLGNERKEKDTPTLWHRLLKNIGIEEEKIHSINLLVNEGP